VEDKRMEAAVVEVAMELDEKAEKDDAAESAEERKRPKKRRR